MEAPIGETWRWEIPISQGVVSLTGAGQFPGAVQNQQLTELAPSLGFLCQRHHELHQQEVLASRIVQADESLLALYDGSYDLPASDRHTVATRIIDLVRSTLQLDRVGLFLRHGDALRGAWGMDEDRSIVAISSTNFPLYHDKDEDLSEAAQIARGELAYFLTQDLDGESRASIEGDIHASISVPMRVGKRIIGVLVADTYYNPRPIDPEIIRPLMVLANQGAADLENAGFYGELQDARDDLERRVDERTDELSGANADKELLLKEVYHRTNNNLQLVVSMLNLQVAHVADAGAAKALEDCAHRVPRHGGDPPGSVRRSGSQGDRFRPSPARPGIGAVSLLSSPARIDQPCHRCRLPAPRSGCGHSTESDHQRTGYQLPQLRFSERDSGGSRNPSPGSCQRGSYHRGIAWTETQVSHQALTKPL